MHVQSLGLTDRTLPRSAAAVSKASLRSLVRRLRGTGRPQPRPDTRSKPRGPTAKLADYVHLHRALLAPNPAHLHPQLLKAAAGGPIEEVLPGIFALRVLSDSALRMFREELTCLEEWATKHRVELSRPNSMNRFGVILDELGYTPLLDWLRTQHLSPLCARLFPEVGEGRMDQHHGFVVDYQMGGDRDLGFHVDDAEVTLNLCLGGGFEGGELYFEGRRCGGHRQMQAREHERVSYVHQPGVGILHAGKHRHGAWPIHSGRRQNLILWLRASTWRAEDGNDDWTCQPWCGDHPTHGAQPMRSQPSKRIGSSDSTTSAIGVGHEAPRPGSGPT